ncbi:triacylglycerol lipase [Crossiella equi]|uniref:Triacylglycerol lipase n=1 Tax=Crossiella equi TaxID=130796 RepID=A0ABS5AC30_9PSEU|nr:alpha/beta fold hydrolase [Crossiella equi]MBP2474136.1 triacylglycerol lipase [Crossiella equi]
MRRITALLGALVITLLALQLPASAATGQSGPACQSAKRPVILLHGTFKKSGWSWGNLLPELSRNGYCAYPLDYGNGGLNPVADSAAELARFVDQVRASTGSSTVDIVGYSQGGMLPRHYLKFLGGASKVNALIGIGPSNHGTTQDLAKLLGAAFCKACGDQHASSEFMRRLNEGGDLAGSVKYTTITTRYDIVVTPHTSQHLAGPADRATNVVLQDKCPGDLSGHLLIPQSGNTVKWVLNALDRGGVADPGFKPC